MFSLAIPKRTSRRLQTNDAYGASSWTNSHINPTPPILKTPDVDPSREYPHRLPMRFLGKGNNAKFDAFQSQSIKRPQMDVYFTEISWQGINCPGQIATRAQFCADKRIQPKDLRLLDSRSRGPSLSVQGEVIIIINDSFRALITGHSVVILDDPPLPNQENRQLTITEDHQENFTYSQKTECMINLLKELSNFENGSGDSLKRNVAGTGYEGVSFELIALASILDVIFVSLERELNRMKFTLDALLAALQKEIRSKLMEQLLQSSHQLQNFVERCSNLQDCIFAVYENAQNVFKFQDRPNSCHGNRDDNQASIAIYHTDVLMLLGEYSAQEMIEEGKDLIKQVRIREETANLLISSNQVDLVYIGLKLEAITIGVTFGALLTGAFGMNLKNGAEEHEFAFFVVFGGIVILCAVIIYFGWLQVSKVGRNC